MSEQPGRRPIGTNLPHRRRRTTASLRRWAAHRARRVRRRWRRLAAWQRRTVMGVAAVVALAVTVTAWLGISAFRELRAARAKLDESAVAVLDRRTEDATELLDGAARDLDQARSKATSFPASVLGKVPLLGSPFRAAESAADAGELVIDGSRLLVTAADRFPTEGVAGVDGNDLSAIHDASLDAAGLIAEARLSFDAARVEMEGPAGATLGWVAGPSERMIDVIDDGLIRLDNAERALLLGAELTGPDADHRILVLAMNSLELRPVGGYFGSFGVLEFRDGTVELVEYASFESLPNPDPPIPAPEYLEVALPGTRFGLENAGWWPEFTRTAPVAADLFERHGKEPVTGVVAVSEDLVGQLLAVFGPITVPGYAEPVSAETFEDRVLYETLLKRPLDNPRKKFTIELSKLVFERLLDLPAEQVPAVGEVFAAAAGRGELLAWFGDDTLQSLLTGTLVAGEFPEAEGDFLAITEANLSASKANKDLVRTISYRLTHDSGRNPRARLTITYDNQGQFDDSVNPFYNGFVRVYAPAGSLLIYDVDADPTDEQLTDGDGEGSPSGQVVADAGNFFDEGIDPDTGLQVFNRNVIVEPGERRSVVLEYQLPDSVVAGSTYRLTWLRQPGTSADTLQVLVDGQVLVAPEGQRRFDVEADLSGNLAMDWLRRRWLVDKLIG